MIYVSNHRGELSKCLPQLKLLCNLNNIAFKHRGSVLFLIIINQGGPMAFTSNKTDRFIDFANVTLRKHGENFVNFIYRLSRHTHTRLNKRMNKTMFTILA